MKSLYESTLEHLYDKYYQDDKTYSSATSSHWQTVGGLRVTKTAKGWKAYGRGFGGAPERTCAQAIKNAPRFFLARSLFTRYRCSLELQKVCVRLARRMGVWLDYDFIRQALSLNKILSTVPIMSNQRGPFASRGIKKICVIGDGYGFFSALSKEIDPSISLVIVNLGRILFFDALSISRLHPHAARDFTFIEAERTKELSGMPIDLFINIASMQEMNPSTVAEYFQLMRESSSPSTYFYCCNRIEKKLPDGTIVRFLEYPWSSSEIIFDELCPWYQKYPVSLPPFWRSFDGEIQHRLVRLK